MLYHVTSGRMVNIMGCDTTLTQFPPAVSSSLHWHALITCMTQERGDLGSNLGAGTFSPPLSTLYMDMISVSQTLIDCACYTNSTMYLHYAITVLEKRNHLYATNIETSSALVPQQSPIALHADWGFCNEWLTS